jgi:indolepyruvate ferredoxin oxidoreductase alpha subunit
MVLKDVVAKGPGTAFLLANEAIARGALEADVKVVAFYPGAPTSEVLDTFNDALGSFDYQMEIATNEKVALEICAGASFAGIRSLTAMKSVGTNVASDTLFVLGYTGVRGGLVMVMADDPHAHSSQTEQDGRFFAPNAYIPMLEPSTPQEAKDMVKKAFEISERHRVPVIIRTVTRVNHQSGIVQMDEINRKEFKKVSWKKLNEEYTTLGEIARQKKLNMLRRAADLEREFESSEFNSIRDASSETGIITSSVSYLYALEALHILGLESKVKLLKLGTTYPLPKELIRSFINSLKKVLVAEELSPYLEKEVYALAKDTNPSLEIIGKMSGAFSEAFEYNPSILVKVIAAAFDLPSPDYDSFVEEAKRLKEILPDRYPTFCPGCPHRATFIALSWALKSKPHFFANDIGCYSMWVFPPIAHADSSLCMGASVGVANGLSHVIEERPVAVVGDSTFYHAALPAIMDAVHNGNRITIIVLDNSVTAMTGQQPNFSTDNAAGGKKGKRIPIEDLLRAMGIGFVEVVDAYDVRGNLATFQKALDYDGPSVVISRRECALYNDRLKRRRGEPIVPFHIEKGDCKKANMCLRDFYCPAYELDEDRQPRISQDLCDGCSVCSKLCPYAAVSSPDPTASIPTKPREAA